MPLLPDFPHASAMYLSKVSSAMSMIGRGPPGGAAPLGATPTGRAYEAALYGVDPGTVRCPPGGAAPLGATPTGSADDAALEDVVPWTSMAKVLSPSVGGGAGGGTAGPGALVPPIPTACCPPGPSIATMLAPLGAWAPVAVPLAAPGSTGACPASCTAKRFGVGAPGASCAGLRERDAAARSPSPAPGPALVPLLVGVRGGV